MQFTRDQVIGLLYGENSNRRFTQDSPVLPDVWIAYAGTPDQAQDLLLTPHLAANEAPLTPGRLCAEIRDLLKSDGARSPSFQRRKRESEGLAYNQATVAARLWFDELVRVILPLSSWWSNKVYQDREFLHIEDLQDQSAQERIARVLADPQRESGERLPRDLLWTIRVAGTIALANHARDKESGSVWPPPPADNSARRQEYFLRVVRSLAKLLKGVSSESSARPMVHLVSLNRKARAGVWRSRAAIKADAARTLFDVRSNGLAWAIIDSGIDARHPALFRQNGDNAVDSKKPWPLRTRVLATYDFTLIRDLLNPDDAAQKKLPRRIQQQFKKTPGLQQDLRSRLQGGRDIDWGLLKDLIRVPHEERSYEPPVHEHGTHVAGILAADWPAGADGNPGENHLRGVCPDINLYDFRVLDQNGEGDEFNVMAAMQFIRHLNAHQDFTVLHGVNLSLSIPHDVRNYACGCTPVCEECERLIGAGIVVVVAAGNEGYIKSAPGGDERYQDISITDPGNAAGVITVGSTHRDAPHTYGVSYFSSRGPTGDGRIKPDLVAPGEKIESTIPDGGLKRMDGTSMAAPHVSGAAALLMSRHCELVGDPVRIKQILCATATDLGRERAFQGHGLVDTLRALQSI